MPNNATWSADTPPAQIWHKIAKQFYDYATAFGMTDQPAPNPLDVELVSKRKCVNYTAFIAAIFNP